MRIARRMAIVATAIAVAMSVLVPEAWGGPRLSWQFHGGGVLPLSAFVHNGFRVDAGETADSGADLAVARLVDQFGNPGFQVGTTFLIDRFEIRYVFSRFTWDREETFCRGQGPIVEEGTGGFDDALVDYECADSALETTNLESANLDPVFLHVISVGYRLYFLDGDGPLEAFAAVAPGLGISSYNDNVADDSNLLGFNLGVGAGLEMSLTRSFAIGLEARYNLLLTGPPARQQDASNRAAARGQSATQAVLDAFHYANVTLGVHINFR